MADGSGAARYSLISSRWAFFISARSGRTKIRMREKNDGERHAIVGDSRSRSVIVHRNVSNGHPFARAASVPIPPRGGRRGRCRPRRGNTRGRGGRRSRPGTTTCRAPRVTGSGGSSGPSAAPCAERSPRRPPGGSTPCTARPSRNSRIRSPTSSSSFQRTAPFRASTTRISTSRVKRFSSANRLCGVREDVVPELPHLAGHHEVGPHPSERSLESAPAQLFPQLRRRRRSPASGSEESFTNGERSMRTAGIGETALPFRLEAVSAGRGAQGPAGGGAPGADGAFSSPRCCRASPARRSSSGSSSRRHAPARAARPSPGRRPRPPSRRPRR